jgi:hypothetical protein
MQGKGAAGSARREAGRARAGAGRADDSRARAGQDRDTWEEATDEAMEDEAGWPFGGRGRGGRGWGDWPGWTGGQGWGGWQGAGGPHGHRTYRDLERLARQFARELRMAAWHAQAVSEDAMGDLRVILDETLDRIKTEVFAGREPGARGPADSAAGQHPGNGPDTSPPPERETGPEPDAGHTDTN